MSGRAARSLLPLSVDGAWLLIEARDVIEILGACPLTRLPGTPTLMPGVTAFRGRAVAVLDVGALLGADPLATRAPRARTVVVELGASTVAIPADAVREVVELQPSEPAGATDEPWVDGRAPLFEGDARILDVARAMPVITAG